LSVDACEIEVIEGRGVIGCSRAHEAFKIINGVVVRCQKEKFGAFLTEVDTASGEIRDNSCDANHVEEGWSLHVIGPVHQGRIPVNGTIGGVLRIS